MVPFPKAPGSFEFLFVAIDKFTKWIEAESVRKITTAAVIKTNGQVERANGIILQEIKTLVFDRLKSYSRYWVDKLPIILWSLRTTPSWATTETPLFLIFGAEAMLPSEIALQSPRVSNYLDND